MTVVTERGVLQVSVRRYLFVFVFFFFKQNASFEFRWRGWVSAVCSSDVGGGEGGG